MACRNSLPRCLVCAALFLLLVTLLPAALSAKGRQPKDLSLTPQEQAWLDQHPLIRVAPDPDFPPVEFFGPAGVYQGISADYLTLLETRLPVKFEIVRLPNWVEVLRQVKTHQVDMLSAAVPTPDRLQYLKFSQPFVEFSAVILVRDSVSDFPKLKDLTGKRVAVVSEYADHEYMKKAYPEVPLEVMPDIASGLRQVSFGKVDAMILNLASASYYIRKEGILNLKVSEDTDFVYDLSFASRNDWPLLAGILEKALATITPLEKKTIYDKWISLGKQGWQPSPIFWASLSAGVLFLITLIVLSWNRVLQRQVQLRTRELQAELEERVLAEREKEQLLRQIHQAKKMEAIGLLAGGVAHDLNNILAGVTGYSDLMLLKLSADSPLYRHAETVRDSGKRAAEVVADMLTISRDASSDKQVNSINTLIDEYLKSPENRTIRARFPKVELVCELAPDLFNIRCSPIHIKKSLMNLLLNAVEATGQGRVTIRSKNCHVDRPFGGYDSIKAGEYVLVTVADSGPGIGAEDLEHIFEPFYSKKKMGLSGTGLGLTVVWNSMQDHAGYVDVKSSASGSSFELYFPVCRDPLGPSVKEDCVDSYRGQGEQILVIDDEEQIRDLAAQMLANLNYHVSTVASGEEAVAFLRQQQVDLLLLDMLMDPGINGCQTYEQVCVLHPGQKAVISSGFSRTADVERAQLLGAGGYLKKPYIFCELAKAVREELDSDRPV